MGGKVWPVGGRTALLLFATAGIALEMLRAAGPEALVEFAVVVVDEVHERSEQSDLLLACLREFMLKDKRLRHLRRLRTAGPTATGNSAYRCIPATSYAQSTRHDRNPPLTTPDGNGANRVIHTRVALTPLRRPARAATMVPTFSFGKGFKDAVKAEYNANK